MTTRSETPAGGEHFAFLQQVDADRLSAVLREESARVGAVVLGQIDRTAAAKVLSRFDAKARSRVAAEMANARRVPPEVLKQIADSLREKIYRDAPAAAPVPGMVSYGGPEVAAAILRYAGPELRRNLQAEEPELFHALRRLVFTFDDFQRTPDRSLQAVFGEVATHELALALKVATPQLKRRILGNMSSRRAQLVEDEIERLGRVRMRDIEEARKNIVDHALALQANGRVVLGDEEETIA